MHIYIGSSGLLHNTGSGHPECIERLATLQELFQTKEFEDIIQIEAIQAETKWLKRVHPIEYIHDLQDSTPDTGLINLDGDTVMCPDSYDAALQAAGAACQAVGDVMSGKTDKAFCAVRPPGHHAEPAQTMGFCMFNNIAIAALHAQAEYAARRVAIIDFDVHHGNGSDTVARQHDGIFYASTHQWPLFPGTGSMDSNIEGRTLNITLDEGTASMPFRRAYTDRIIPALNEFAPDLVMISAGFDAHKDDPIGGLNLDEDDFVWITNELMKVAATHCQGKIVSVLEGGYNLKALSHCVSAHVKTLAGKPL